MDIYPFEPKELLSSDPIIREKALCNAIFNLGPQTYHGLLELFQQKSNLAHKRLNLTLDALITNHKLIVTPEKEFRIYAPVELVPNTRSFEAQCCVRFLKHILNLRDKKNKYIFYKTISHIKYCNEHPIFYTLIINEQVYSIRFVHSFEVLAYNETLYNRSTDNIILISDDQLNIEDVTAKGIVNVVTFDKDYNINILR